MGYKFLSDPDYLAFEEEHAKKLQALEVQRKTFMEQYSADWDEIMSSYQEGVSKWLKTGLTHD